MCGLGSDQYFPSYSIFLKKLPCHQRYVLRIRAFWLLCALTGIARMSLDLSEAGSSECMLVTVNNYLYKDSI